METRLDRDGRWSLLRPVGRGRDGRVWLGHDSRTGARVAVKRAARAARERIAREFAIAATVRHPRVARVVDWGLAIGDGSPYLVSEWCGPTTLAARRGPPSVERWYTIAIGLLSALEAVHQAGWIHRDLKPANVVCDTASSTPPRLIDFGLAAPCGRREAVGVISGAPAYVPPEAIRGRPVGPSGDLYALGLLLYGLATGRAAVPRGSLAGAVAWHLDGPPPAEDPELDAARLEWIRSLCRRDPAERPASARAARRRLNRLTAATARGSAVPT